ncbi:MAG: PAS domain S-box protein, partial [Coprothermobacterota bacterium]|nr:PAS domain S-box protein [Coprothermobacterota bacterium]
DDRYLLSNNAMANAYGTIPANMQGKTDLELGVPAEEFAKYRQDDIEVLQSGKEKIIPDESLTWHSGEVHYYHTTKRPLLDEKGEFNSILAVCVDITERKRTEEALKESEELFKSVVRNSSNLTILTDAKGIVTYLSPQCESVIGHPIDRFIGQIMPDIIFPDDVEKCREAWEQVVKREQDLREFEYRIIDGQGAIRWLTHSAKFITVEGRNLGMQNTIGDITERKQAEEALRESEERWQFALEGAGDGLWDWNAQTNQVYFSHKWKAMLGYGDDEIGNTLDEWGKRIHPDDRERAYAALNPHLEGRAPAYISEHRVLCKDGTYKWILDRGMVISRTLEGKPLRVIGTHSDITERKILEAHLEKERREFKLIVDSSPILIFYKDQEGRFVRVNKAFAEATKVSEDEVLGKTVFDFYSAKIAQGMTNDDQEVLKLGRPKFNIMERYESPSGIRWVRTDKVPTLDENGVVIGLLGFAQDITERKQAEESLRSEQMMLARTEGIARVGSWEWDIATDTVTWSDELFRIFQRDPQEGAPSFAEHPAFYHPDDMSRMRQAVEVAVADGTPYELEMRANRKDGETRVCMARGVAEMALNGRASRLFGSLQDITERKIAEEKLLKSYEFVKKTLNDAINTMVKIVELRDPYTAGHQQKVADLATAIAGEMKLEDTRIDQLRTAAMIHDIGKMYVPSDILSKPGKLSDIELRLIKTHSQSGYDIVKGMDFPGVVAQAVLQHHERLDGSGYPNGLKSEDTLLEAKILA